MSTNLRSSRIGSFWGSAIANVSTYGATNLYTTVALALCTFVLTHYAGIRAKGVGGYFKGMAIPSAPPVLKQMLFVLWPGSL